MKRNKYTNIPDGFPFSGQTCFLDGSSNLKDYLHGGFDDELKNNEASVVLKKMIKKYGIPKCGRNRATFISKNFVIKIPLNNEGEVNNSVEANFISDNTAKGRLLVLNGFTCVIQEKMTATNDQVDFNLFPEWVKNIDSCQVGYDANGNIKAYDFAEDIDYLKDKKQTININQKSL